MHSQNLIYVASYHIISYHIKSDQITSNPIITYLPRKAVAEVSNHNEPIGRKCGFEWVRMLVDFRFNCFDFRLI